MTEVHSLHFDLAGGPKEYFLRANLPDADAEADQAIESLQALNRLDLLRKMLGCDTCPALRPENRPVKSATAKHIAGDDDLLVRDRGWEEDEDGGHNRASIHCLALFNLASTEHMANCATGVDILHISEIPTQKRGPARVESSPSRFIRTTNVSAQ